jgi:hypothetical protein
MDHADLVARLLEAALRTGRRDGLAPSAEMRELAAELAKAVPVTVARLPGVLNAAGPEAASYARSQARSAAGNAACPRAASLGASEAARLAGISSRAVRFAAASGRLAARRHPITGVWLIDLGDLAEWMEARNAA